MLCQKNYQNFVCLLQSCFWCYRYCNLYLINLILIVNRFNTFVLLILKTSFDKTLNASIRSPFSEFMTLYDLRRSTRCQSRLFTLTLWLFWPQGQITAVKIEILINWATTVSARISFIIYWQIQLSMVSLMTLRIQLRVRVRIQTYKNTA